MEKGERVDLSLDDILAKMCFKEEYTLISVCAGLVIYDLILVAILSKNAFPTKMDKTIYCKKETSHWAIKVFQYISVMAKLR